MINRLLQTLSHMPIFRLTLRDVFLQFEHVTASILHKVTCSFPHIEMMVGTSLSFAKTLMMECHGMARLRWYDRLGLRIDDRMMIEALQPVEIHGALWIRDGLCLRDAKTQTHHWIRVEQDSQGKWKLTLDTVPMMDTKTWRPLEDVHPIPV